ncbi:MAG: ABC transporter ATP-binding protein [Duncaniella sp.]|nr:ABC transporter ATP-binding protein [Duncaniella sp.]
MIDIDNLTFYYHRRSDTVIRDLSMHLGNGGIYGLLGCNGVGKTTLLNLMAGALFPVSGSVTFNGENVDKRLPETMQSLMVVPDEINLPAMKLDRWVSINAPFYPEFSHELMAEAIEMFQVPVSTPLNRMSMGERKKVYIAFALAANTRLLLMDEPTNGLDIPAKAQFRRLLAMTDSSERLIIISSHQVRDLDGMLDHIIIMADGGIVLNESIDSIAERLDFRTLTYDDTCHGKILYSQPVIGGQAVITPHDPSLPLTKVDIEMLFNYSVTDSTSLTFFTRND